MNALRTIPIVLDPSNAVQIERYMKTVLKIENIIFLKGNY